MPLLAVALVMLMAAPAVALGLAADPDLGAAGRLLWLGSALALTIAGIVIVTRHLLLARRWARSAAVFELSNFASGSPGNGDASSLLAHVIEQADEQGLRLVLRVDPSNERAIVLYRRHGFVEVEGVSSTSQVSMERTTRDVGTTARIEHRFLLVAAVVVAVLAIAVTEMASPLMVVLLALALMSLGVAAGADLRSMRIPNSLLVVAVLFGAVAADVTNAGLGPLAGAGIAAVPLLLIHLLDPGAIGFGDVKFAAVSGAVVAAIAWSVAIMVPLVGFIGVAVVRIATPRRPQPFGPYLMVATTVAVIAASFISNGANV
ncbi:MAG: GNAT family N-acetyltransferase [Ilumatobacter sp.]|uniref:GNAT family N-acetyltransferase n=1 Tax=Ilumatobacter sp. TaxID=1967498 RepID=UPI00391B21BD